MHPADARLLRAYWRATYRHVKITRDGIVMARKKNDSAWSVLETAAQAQESIKVLRAQEQARESARYGANKES